MEEELAWKIFRSHDTNEIGGFRLDESHYSPKELQTIKKCGFVWSGEKWMNTADLECDIEFFIGERGESPEQFLCKHKFDVSGEAEILILVKKKLQTKKGIKMNKNQTVNKNGLSYDRWLAAAGFGDIPASAFTGIQNAELKSAWKLGYDPCVFRAARFQEIKIVPTRNKQ